MDLSLCIGEVGFSMRFARDELSWMTAARVTTRKPSVVIRR